MFDAGDLPQPSTTQPEPTQQRFDITYIGSVEISGMLGVSRQSVHNKLIGRFPIVQVGNAYLWERSPEMMHFLAAWKLVREG